MSEENKNEFQLTREEVFARDDSAIGLFGWTFTDMGIVAGAFVFGAWLFAPKIGLLMAALGYLYVKKLKKTLPDGIIGNFLKFQLKRDFLYRAIGRDTEWAQPITYPEKKKRKK